MSLVVGLLVASMAVWIFIVYHRRRKRLNIEGGTEPAVGTRQVLPLDEVGHDVASPLSLQRPSAFEDGTAMTSPVDYDLDGPSNSSLNHPLPVSGGGEVPVAIDSNPRNRHFYPPP